MSRDAKRRGAGRLARLACAAAIMWLASVPAVQADDATPPPVQIATPQAQVPEAPNPPPVAPTAAPIVIATPAPAPAPVAAETPLPDTGPPPISVAPEHHATVKINEPAIGVPTPSGVSEVPRGSVVMPGQPQRPDVGSSSQARHSGVTGPATGPIIAGAPLPGQSTSTSAAVPPALPPPDQSSSYGQTIINVNSSSAGAQAPAQLSCHGTPKGTGDPFMVAPYSGWSEINSFFDHDSPDYSRDGEIILSNGLTASSSDGISSDFFPAYWSPALRQYINYDGHNGYDFGISYQPVLAAGDGTVRFAGWNDSDPSVGYGQMVLIDHHNGYVTLYGHLSKLEVKIGDKVQAGEEIGISGSTGNSTGPHLHFSVFHNCQVTDPYGWTGHGADPVQGFNGEQSAYLWLPGHDPLVLNPPPKWSAFPLGLKVPLPRRDIPLGIRRVPPVDRLLLLKLPLPRPGRAVGSAVALARTESLVTQEAEAVAPYLADLQAQGMVETYAVIPAAAAVWLRGTATAAQLEGLPGVASLAGVQPRDLIAAQAGLSHSILIQIGGQQAPSLWPVAFRSSLQAWRPITTVPNNSALVTGFAQPGQHVVVSLMRGSSLAGATEALGDSETGGFVAMIHDRSGNPVLTRTGDSVEVRIGNRTERVAVMSCSLKARPRRISGQAPPGATVALSVMDTSESVVWKTVTTASQLGRFGTNLPFALPAGSLAVASVVDAAGNQESATGFVPGVQIEENSPTVHGWTVGASPRFWVVRHGRTVIDRRVHPAPDGTFQIELQTGKQPMALVPGDVVSIGSRWHHHVFTVPGLHIRLPLFSSRVTVAGPPRAVAHITAFGNDGHTWNRKLRFGASGSAQVSWPAGAVGTGDAATLDFVTAAGDTVVAGDQVRGFIVREGDSLIRGRTRPGTTLSIHALTAKGVPLGGTVVASDAATGTFSTRLHDAAGHPVAVNGAVRLVVRDTASTITVSAPALTLQMGQKQAIAWTVPRASVLLTTVDRVQGEQIHRLKADASGRVLTGVAPADGPQRINVSLTVQDGLTVERSVVLDGSRHRSATIRSAARKPAHAR